MQPISTYANTDAFLRVVLQGEPKAGKTTLACQFPGAYIIDADVNLGGPLRYLRQNNLTLPIGYDVLDKDEEGKDVPPMQRYQRFTKLLNQVQPMDEVKTIVIDSATSFAEILLDETKRLQPSVKDGRQLWGFFFTYGKELMSRLKLMRKHIVFIVHEKLERTPDGSIIFPYRIAWPGQLGLIMASFFTDVWRCEVVSKQVGMETKYTWQVRTMPDYQFKLGNSLGLPPVFEFNWDMIQAKLDEANKVMI